ncbi:hypothetical protein D3C73_881620 [compost metagenome]
MDADGGRLAQHAAVQDRTQVAQRPEDLGAGHQHDQQCLDAHLARGHAPGAQRQSQRRAQRHAQVADAARQQAYRQHPERVVRQAAGTGRQAPTPGLALAVRLQRGQALHRVQEVFAEGIQRLRACLAGAAVQHVHRHRAEQREQRRHQKHQRGGHVPECDHGEDGKGRGRRNRDLRQVLTEEGLQLLHAVHHGQHDAARALIREPSRPQGDDAVVQLAAQGLLDLRRGVVGLHGAPMVEQRAQQHHGAHAQGRHDPVLPRRAVEHAGQQLAQEHITGNARRQRQEAQENAARHAGAQSRRQAPQPRVEIHINAPCRACMVADPTPLR